MIPEIVLIHGSWMGGWCWRAVAEILRARGVRCHAPTLTGLGEREHLSRADINLDQHILDVLNACRFADVARPLLVGHSYGALVAAGVADQLQGEVSGLVVIDGFIVDSGQSAFDAYPQVRDLLGACITPAYPNFIQPLPIAAFDVHDGVLTDELARKLRPMPLTTHTTPLNFSPPLLRRLPRTYIRCTDFPIFAATAARAVADGWTLAEIGAGHMAVVTHPALIADAIVAAAQG